MFSLKSWKRLAPLLLFFLGYSLLFFLWVKTFLYTLPFLAGFLIALAVQPVIGFLQKRLKLPHGPATLAATILALVVLCGGLALLGVLAVREITAFLTRAAQNGFAEFSQPVTDFLNRAGEFLSQFDLDFLELHSQEILEALQNSMDLVVTCMGAALRLLTSLPTIVTLVIVAVCAAFFFARDMKQFLAWGRGFFSETAAFHISAAVKNSGGTGRKYILSYLFLYFLTFCQTCVIMAVLGVPYPLLIGFLTAVADVLPVLGPVFVLVPVAVYQLLIGQYARALGIAIGWLVITFIRQVVEPKLVASSVKIHPLATLAAVYFSLVAQSFWVLFYVLGLCALYGAFRETGALPALVEQPEKSAAPSKERADT